MTERPASASYPIESGGQNANDNSPAKETGSPTAQDTSSSRIIIRLQDELTTTGVPTGNNSLDRTMTQFGAQNFTPLFRAEQGNTALKKELGLSRTYVVTISTSNDQQDAISAFSDDPSVEYAESDPIGYGAGMPDDLWFQFQWNLRNTGQSGGTPGADADAPEAWDLTTGLTSTVLAVIDTGVDLDHEDLVGQLVNGYDFVDDDPTPQDDHGHGTHVAGIAAAATDNGFGVAGVCPACRVMPLKGLDSSNEGLYSWWAAAIEHAVDEGADAINMSMGGATDSQTLHDAVRYAYEVGVPIAAAMMNDGDDTIYYPAVFTETIAVGATDRNDERWSDSNFGDHIDLVAPGASIFSTTPDDNYESWNGTSMAAPHVTGALGLVHAVRPGYTVEELRHILRTTAEDQVGPANEDKKGRDTYFGAGRLNIAQAVQKAIPPDGVTIDGPARGIVGTERTFIAAVTPLTAAQPITYVWRATGQSSITHTAGLTDAVTFTWATSDTQTITATVINFGGLVTGTYTPTIRTLLPEEEITVCAGDACDLNTIQEAVDVAGASNTIKVATGVYTGVNQRENLAQVVYISKTVTIRGGYDAAFAAPPDPQANPVIVDAEGGGRALYITGEPTGQVITPTINGLRIKGGDAAGLGGGLGGGDAGGGIYAIDADPTISDSRIISNTARWGGGVYLWESDATLSANTITQNTARWGGGLYAESGSEATLTENIFSQNSAEREGGGLYLRESATILRGNVITGNHAVESAGGLYLYECSSPIKNNAIVSNTARWGGGVYHWKSDATLDGNAITGNVAEDGGGLYLGQSVPLLVNNLIVDNTADQAGAGMYVKGSSPRLIHATIAHNGGEGLHVTNDEAITSTVALTNTILAGHTVGVTATAGTTVTLEAVLWYDNVDDWGGAGAMLTSTLAQPYWGDPRFAAPEAGDYHLGPNSEAIDRGVDAGISDDRDGERRPIGLGYDLGADEFPAALQMSQRASSNLVQTGQSVTFTMQVTNTGNITLHLTITATHAASPWTPLLAPDESLLRTVVVTIETNYHGPLTNTVRVTTDEGPSQTLASAALVVPALTTADPAEEHVWVTPDGHLTVQIPTGALTEATQFVYTSRPTVTHAPTGFLFAGAAFDLDAYRRGQLQPDLSFTPPITLTSCASDTSALSDLDENTSELRYWDGESWAQDGITTRDIASPCLTATVDHLTTFAMFGQEEEQVPRKVYLPVVLR